MNDLTTLVGTELSFETTAHPFREMFLDRVNDRFVQGRPPLSDLSQLAEIVDVQSIGPVYQQLYSLMDEADFQSLYRRFIEQLVAPLVKLPFRFQRKPGIRIHLPAILTVQYHTDEWYGHGPDVVNFWMPLTDAFDSNTLFVATLDDSLREVARLEAEKASMEIINGDLAEIVQPLTTTYGRVHVFNAKVVHGSKPNQTGKTRVSLDFRILPEGADPGLKPIDEYYTTLQPAQAPTNASAVSPDASRACSYLFGAHGFTRHISTANQRLICAEFARKHDIQILAEETEIRTMTHHPTLLALAEGTGTDRFDAMLLFSALCLPAGAEDRLRIFRTALQNRVSIFFANERMQLVTEADIAAIEQLWRQLSAAA